MARKLNACTKKKLKRSVFVLIVAFIIVFSIITINTVVQGVKSSVATSEEMKACSSTLESIYKKLDSEEIKLLSEDGSMALTCSVPNKEFGKVTISGDSEGNLMFIYDYQESEMNEKLFLDIFGTIVMLLFGIFCVFGLLFSINGLFNLYRKKKISKKQNEASTEKQTQTETQTETQSKN